MKKGMFNIDLVLKITGVLLGTAGFYTAAFIEPRIGGMLIALASIIIAIPIK